MRENNIKIFQKDNQFLFLCIREDFTYYKVKPYFDKYGELCEYREKLKAFLMAVDSLNNIHKKWRINGWKKAQQELENEGYVFIKDLPISLVQLTQNYQHKNLIRFINNEELQPLKNKHDFKKGQKFCLKSQKNVFYRIKSVGYNYINLEHLHMKKVKDRNGRQRYFSEQIEARRFQNIVNNKLELVN